MLFNFNDLVTKHEIKINGVIHIGAHYGQEHDLYTSVNAKHIVYYEPHPKSYSKLKKNLLNKSEVTLVNKALGSSEGIVKMHCSKENSGMSNSILKPKDHSIIYPSITFDHTVDIEMTTLDKEILLMADNVRCVLNAIVMDVQGFELEVLKGSRNTLNQINCIFTEVNFRHMYESCPLINDIDAFLSSFGFKRLETFDTGSGWGDALYLK